MISHLPYPITLMKESFKRSRYIWLSLGFFCLSLSSFGQTKSELQEQRNTLNNQIEYTKKLISEAKKGQKNTTSELVLLDKQISYRERLLRNIRTEISGLQDEINAAKKEIAIMEQTIDALKQEYAKMIYQAYKNRNAYDRLMYIFASENFYQAYRRLKVMQHYADVRKQHAQRIMDKQDELATKITGLTQMRAEKEALADASAQEQEKLAQDKGKRQSSLEELKQKEAALRKQQKSQEAEKQKLNQAIQRIIEAELKAEKAKNNGRFELTPAGKIVNENFEKNKGYLHWPVLRGVITGHFGTHPHPSIPGISIESNGIDISTEKDAKVVAIFEGQVSKVFTVPGAGMNVIIQHGAYRTVYAYLKDVKVKVGDVVSAQQAIGTVLNNHGENITHFEIWKMSSDKTSAINPEAWISGK